MSGTDTGTPANGEPSPDVAEFADLLPPVEGDEGGAGGQAPGADPTPPTALAKFGNDPAALAKGYSDLESRFGQQGTELGQVRKLVEALTTQLEARQGGEANNGTGGGESDDFESFMAEIEEAEQSGQVDYKKVMGEMWQRMQATIEAKQKPLADALGMMNQAGTYGQFINNNPDAKPYERMMKKLVRDNPELLPDTLTGAALQKRLGMLHMMSVAIEAKLRSGGSAGRGSPDTGTSRRVGRRSAGGHQLDQAAANYERTGHEVHLHQLVQQVLAK